MIGPADSSPTPDGGMDGRQSRERTITVDRRPSGWYAQLYRHAYGDTVSTGTSAAPTMHWVGLALVALGVFTPWIRPRSDWIAAATSLDVPLRATWGGRPATGTGSSFPNSVTGLSVGFCAIVLGIASVLVIVGRLPRWVRTVASLGIVLMPTAVAAQIARDASDTGVRFVSVAGPGMLVMVVGGALIGLARGQGTAP